MKLSRIDDGDGNVAGALPNTRGSGNTCGTTSNDDNIVLTDGFDSPLNSLSGDPLHHATHIVSSIPG